MALDVGTLKVKVEIDEESIKAIPADLIEKLADRVADALAARAR